MSIDRAHMAHRVLLFIGIVLLFAPAAAAQVLIGETTARFDWDAAAGSVDFYEVHVSRSSQSGGSYQLEQTVTTHSAFLDGGVGEVLRIQVRAGNSTELGPMSAPSSAVRFGLPSQLPVVGSPGVFQGRASGANTDFVFHADPATGEVWQYSLVDATAAPVLVGTEPDPGWTVFASGDFDGDGSADLFWRHPAGATRIWFVDVGSYQEEFGPTYPGNQWMVEVSADFDGNGQDDLLWRQDRGTVLGWFRVESEFTLALFPTMWPGTKELLSAGDYDGDGMDDVFWRDTQSTDTSIWFMSVDPNAGPIATPETSERQSTQWEVFESRDHNQDGTDDLRWRMKTSHDVTEWWLMSGPQVSTQ
jgi:hypothetical protein